MEWIIDDKVSKGAPLKDEAMESKFILVSTNETTLQA